MTTKTFQHLILSWYRESGRHDLPWRKTIDPYRILISEVMLQQTQVARVIEKYRHFLRLFPTVRELARSDTRRVLGAWQGLGYNRRALNLHRAARTIALKHRGRIPRDLCELESLPGVGAYTARSVRAFAWNEPDVLIETNIRRVFLHFFLPRRRSVPDSDIGPFVRKVLWKKDPRRWYWALMDYGALALRGQPNANRRSASYTRQPRFEGSMRQARALIMRHLLRIGAAPVAAIPSFLESVPSLRPHAGIAESRKVISGLERDGFLKTEGGRLILVR